MIILVTLSIYVPQFFVKPQYDFLYLIGNNNCYTDRNNTQIYSVQNNKVVKNVQDDAVQRCTAGQIPQPKIFRYDVVANKSTEVSFDDVKNLTVDSSPKSPDGFEIIRGSNSGGFFPFYFYSGSDYNSRYINGRNVSKKLNLQQDGYNFVLLGWIK